MPSRLPEDDSPVGREAQQAQIEVAPFERRCRLLERRHRGVDEVDRVPEPVHAHRNRDTSCGHHRGAGRKPGGARDGEAGLEPRHEGGRAHRQRHERDHPGRRLRALGGLDLQVPVVGRQPGVRMHRQERPDGADRARGRSDDELHAVLVERHQRDQPRGQADQGAAAEREVEGGHQRDERGGGQHPHEHPAPRRESEREDDADDREGAQAVPVPDRLVEAAVATAGGVHAERARIQARDHAVARDRGRGRHDATSDRHTPAVVGQQEQRRAARDVDQHQVDVLDGGGPVGGPHPRDRRPGAQPRHAGDGGQGGPGQAQVARPGQDHDDDDGVERSRQAPGAVKVSAFVSRQEPDRDRGEGERCEGRPRTDAGIRDVLADPPPCGPRATLAIDRSRTCQLSSSSWYRRPPGDIGCCYGTTVHGLRENGADMAKRLRHRSLTSAIVAVALLGAVGAGTAYAATPASQQYGGVKGVVTGGGGNGPSGGVLGETTGGGTLPFTGADLGLYATAGLGMIGAGFLLRRAGSRRS